MKKRKGFIKIIIRSALAVVVLVAGYFALAFFGSPVSAVICKISAEKYVAENYPGYHVEKTGYNFKDCDYYAHINMEGKKDAKFRIDMDWWGNVTYDSYQHSVSNGSNTSYRISREYNRIVEEILLPEQTEFISDIFFADIVTDNYGANDDTDSRHIFPTEELIADKEYDYTQLGYKYGHIVMYARDEDVSVERACEILLYVKQKLKENDIGFYTIDFTLKKPKKDGRPYESERINVNSFKYEDIYAENFEERLIIAHNRLETHHMEQDKLNGVTDTYYFK